MTTGSNDFAAFLLRLGLGFLWLWEGMTKIRYPSLELVDIVMGTRLIPASFNLRPWVPVLGISEALLGACLLVGFRTRAITAVQSVLIIVFTVVLIVGYPDLMFHPLGPLIKNFAILAAQWSLWVMGGGRILSLDTRWLPSTAAKSAASRSGSLFHR